MKSFGLILFRVLIASVVCLPAHAVCSPSTEAAVQQYLTNATVAGSSEGFRVVSLRRDPLQLKTWAMVEQCKRPELPLRAVQIAAKDAAALGPVVVIHVGEAVTVRQADGASRMELSGIAEESGGLNKTIRVRLPKLSEQDDSPAPRLRCKVTGSGQVEVVQ